MISDNKYKDLLKDDADSVCNCIWMHTADEYKSCWYDCTHPQRLTISCPYYTMKECNLAVPDVEQQELQIEMAVHAKQFWEKERELENKKEHICDINDEDLKNRHRHVLSLIGKYDPIKIGTLIAGKYYKDIWSSRSCSGKLSRLIGGNDYMDFYCGSSAYYIMNILDRKELHNDFESMDKLDKTSNNAE